MYIYTVISNIQNLFSESQQNKKALQKTLANMYCEPSMESNWTDLFDAKRNCMRNKDCKMFYDYCGMGMEYKFCSHTSEILLNPVKSSGCGSILYTYEGE